MMSAVSALEGDCPGVAKSGGERCWVQVITPFTPGNAPAPFPGSTPTSCGIACGLAAGLEGTTRREPLNCCAARPGATDRLELACAHHGATLLLLRNQGQGPDTPPHTSDPSVEALPCCVAVSGRGTCIEIVTAAWGPEGVAW